MIDESAIFSQRTSLIPRVVLETTTATVQFAKSLRVLKLSSSLSPARTTLRGGADVWRRSVLNCLDATAANKAAHKMTRRARRNGFGFAAME
tara:strand:- start:189 stop:464 length:276 start_codon:yes stop_codon:yes gene_type:complete